MVEIQIPRWNRIRAEQQASEAAASFGAGASLAILDQIMAASMPARGVWLDRLALRAAAAAAQALGRAEDDGAIRDAIAFRAGGADPGPAGRAFLLWRGSATRSPSLDRDGVLAAIARFGLKPDDSIVPLVDAALAPGPSALPPVVAAARAALAWRGDRPELAVIGAWLGDLVLAHRLGWPVTLPLLAAPLLSRSWRSLMGPGTPPADWARWYAGAGGGATHAVDLAADLGRRATLLLAAAPRLRAKAASKVVDELLSQDVLAASATLAGISDRGLRRLFERLLALGAIRELSGRPSFRLYGL